MILGMTKSTFTLLHVLLSLVGIGSGLIVVFGMLTGRRLNSWTAIFLSTTVLTSITGFLFPIKHLGPAHKIGVASLILLALAIVARYAFHLAGAWARTYVLAAMTALYFNVLIAVAQAFMKVPVLKALAPTRKDPPFLVAESLVLALFIALTILAAKRFRGDSIRAL